MTGLGPVSEGDAVKPMQDALSDRRVDDPTPDGAALDELRKAFGVDDAPADRPDDGDATGLADRSEEEPFEFEIVEQEPYTPAPDGTADEPVLDELQDDVEQPPSAPLDDSLDHELDQELDQELDDDAEAAIDAKLAAAEPPAPSVIRIDDYGGDDGTLPVDPLIAGARQAARSGATAADAEGGERQLISIDNDDIPDAVYVEGSLESGGSRSIVFIEDDVDSDAMTPESDRDLRRGIEPRMRERRAAVKRAQGRKRLKWLIAAFVVVILGVAALATFGSSLFAIEADQVTVTGNVYTDPERLQAVIDDLVGTPVLVADTNAAERRLEEIPWVDDAKVTTRFPHAAQIEIREREAIATYQGPDGKFRVLDREGRVLDVLEKYPFAYVLITGPDPVDLEPSEFAPQGYQGAAELAKNLTGTVRGQVERVEVTANGSRLAMWLDDGSEVRFGEARDLFAKLVRLETVLTQNPDREPGPIDISTSQATV
jgi:cell division protein FtsQ